MVREVYFPGKDALNKDIVVKKQAEDPEFDKFFLSLVAHKKELGHINTKTPLMQAVNTLSVVLQQKGGGKKIPQTIKNFFIDTVGRRQFDQALVNQLEGEEEWDRNYEFMMQRYGSKHNVDMSIRQFVKAAQKKQ